MTMKSKQMMPAGRPARIRGKCAAFLAALCLFSTLATALGEGGEASRPQRTVYGASEQGRELVCWRVGPEDASRAFLMVFAVHGFEDRFARDGLLLTQIARRLLDHYALYPEALGDTALYIVPCANPDGLAEGSSNTGFGRCNALGLDINRDFPEGWVRRGQSANRTGEAPLATAEARALVGQWEAAAVYLYHCFNQKRLQFATICYIITIRDLYAQFDGIAITRNRKVRWI